MRIRSDLSPFADLMRETDEPYFRAIPDKVSPALTVCLTLLDFFLAVEDLLFGLDDVVFFFAVEVDRVLVPECDSFQLE